MNRDLTLSAVYSYIDELNRSIRVLKENAINDFTVYSPIPDHEIEETISKKPSPVKYFTLFGAVFGFLFGFFLAFFSSGKWNLITGGKPVLSLWPFIVIGFELTILGGALATLLGLLINARLPRTKKPKGYNDKFSEDKFGITIKSNENEKERIIILLTSNGAEEVNIEY
jgi:molybdopterin-containing oxidoreductase family membrane subunit